MVHLIVSTTRNATELYLRIIRDKAAVLFVVCSRDLRHNLLAEVDGDVFKPLSRLEIL
jgi:hypothetical protein